MDYVFESTNGKRYTFPTHINELVIDRKNAKVSEVFIVIVEPGKAVHLHLHRNVEQVFYILEGNGILTIGAGNKKHAVRPTQVVKIPPGTVHSIRAQGNKPIRYLCVDCFCGSKALKERTWDNHVKTICRDQGYAFNDITGQ
jgi:mannose-6-phosphate isomerase-like protein (cupin superfamily)